MTDRSKGVVLVVLIAIAAVAYYISSRGPSVSVIPSFDNATAPYRPLAVDNPELQRGKLESSRGTEYKGTGRDLFSMIAPPPPESEKPKQVAAAPTGPVVPAEPPPPVLPANLKYFGYGTIPNGTAKRAFLSDGEQIIIVGEGDTLLGRFRVVKIGNANLDFEEIASGRRGSTALSDEPTTTNPNS
jgi:hypothetical protein